MSTQAETFTTMILAGPAKPPVLRRLSSAEARALSLLARHGSHARIKLTAADDISANVWKLVIVPGHDTGQDAPTGLKHVDIEWAGARLRLGLPADGISKWLAARTSTPLPPGPLPEPLAAAALEALLNELLERLNQSSRAGPAFLAGPADDAGNLPHSWTIRAQAQDAAFSMQLSLQADSLGLVLLAGLLEKSATPANNTIDPDKLPISIVGLIGETTIAADELQSLSAHDVIFLDHYLVDAKGELWLAPGNGQGLKIRPEDASYRVTLGWTKLMTESTPNDFPGPADSEGAKAPSPNAAAGPLDNDSSPAAADDGPEASGSPQGQDSPDEAYEQDATPDGDDTVPAAMELGSIPVRLQFDLGERHIKLGELRQLQPGEVFDLRRPLAGGPVMIRANGAIIGTGELVEVEGRIGVMVHTIGKAGT